MIEALDAGADVARFVITARDRGEQGRCEWRETEDLEVCLEGIGTSFLVLHTEEVLPKWLGRFRRYLNLVRQCWYLLIEARRFRAEVVYVDRANVLVGALFARFFKVSVVLRVMGVTPSMRKFTEPGLWNRIALWSYASPFKHVICSEDGSGCACWIRERVRPSVNVVSLMNGVDYKNFPTKTPIDAPQSSMKVVFVGRLDPIKGCIEFVDAILELPPVHASQVDAVLVGGGQMEMVLRKKVKDSGAQDRVKILGNVPHDAVMDQLATADVYVSLNKMGNLSNANLEAFAMGVCTIIPDLGSTNDTNDINGSIASMFPSDTVVRISRDTMTKDLSANLILLLLDSEQRHSRGLRTADAARKHIPSWDRRIKTELDILRQAANTCKT